MKKKIALTALIMLIILSLTGGVQAFQATSKGTSVTHTATDWIKNIRKMENSGAGLGLSEEINETTLLTEGENNDIDVHMLKNTEYGAILLLGASDYGKQGTDPKGTTTETTRRMDKGNTTGATYQASTTGNRYGVYEMGYVNMNISSSGSKFEWVAGGGSSFINTEINPRYIDRYTTNEDLAKAGDATVETKGWHGSSSAWLYDDPNGFYRGFNGTFSYFGDNNANLPCYARAGVVVGAGL